MGEQSGSNKYGVRALCRHAQQLPTVLPRGGTSAADECGRRAAAAAATRALAGLGLGGPLPGEGSNATLSPGPHRLPEVVQLQPGLAGAGGWQPNAVAHQGCTEHLYVGGRVAVRL